jgi:quinoprotein glucose dehydrogenase
MLTGAFAQDRQYTSWRDYAGSADSAQYSGLRQVNRSNVNQLQVAWTYPTGDGRKYFFNPIVHR